MSVDFKAIPVDDIPANSICTSCIWWDKGSDCYFTHVDVIHLLEQLIAALNGFTIEKKRSLRCHFEGFRPLTISKTTLYGSELFKTVMAFGNPRPKDMEKDLRVFP